MKVFFAIGILALFQNLVFAQQNQSLDVLRADRLYKEADSLFQSLQASEETDKQALKKFELARSIYKRLNINNRKVIDTYYQIGNIYENQNELIEAINVYRASLSLRRKLIPKVDTSYFKTYLQLGGVYYRLEKYDSAVYFLEQAEQLALFNPAVRGIQRLYNVLGNFYASVGNYRQSINHFERAIYEASKLNSKYYHTSQLVYEINLATALTKLGKYEEALSRYKKVLLNEPKYETLYQKFGGVYQKIGIIYFNLKNYDSSLVYLNKSLHVSDLHHRLLAYNFLGKIFYNKNDYPGSLSYYHRITALAKKELGDKNVEMAQAYLGKGQVREAQGHWKAALSYYHLGVQALHFNFNSTNMLRNPEDFSGAVSQLDLFEALRHKARGWRRYYGQTKQLSHLKASLKTYELALKLANQIRRSYDSDEAKLFFTRNVFPAYEEAVAVSYQLHQLTGNTQYAQTAFAFSEGSKAAVLAETLRGLDIRNAQNVPVNLLNEEREIRRKITKLTIATMEAKDTSQTQRYREQSRDLEIQLAQVLKRMEKSSAYYQLKYQNDSLNIADLQNSLLDKRTALVEYFLGSQEIYAFIITSGQLQTVRIPIRAHYREAVSQLRRDLYAHEPGRSNRIAWAHPLYQQLIAPIRSRIGDKERLILVPDGELNYLPFEALTADPEGRNFLLREFTVQYAYSATLLQRAYGHNQRLKPNSTLLAMAPFADSIGNAFRSAQIVPLPASKTEVENIGGRIYLKSDATKDVFLKVAQSYGIIHLATHAKADNDEPLNSYITFYPKNADSLAGYRLYTNELYNLRLDSAKLVVLSACETGGGRLVRGEGVMSLARAFAYAGCPNIVMTLWKAEDRTTADVIARMHNYLKKGYTKDAALRQAKLDYLDSDLPDYRKEPYFWANFVFIGHHAPIYPSQNGLWLVITVAVVLVLGIIFYLERNQPRGIRG